VVQRCDSELSCEDVKCGQRCFLIR
jgi:hypothetical protein